MCGKFTEKPDCTMLTMKQFGKPRLWKPWRVDAPSRPLLGERHAVAAVDLVAGAARVVGADLEAGGVDQAVELVLDAVDDDAALGDALDAPAVGVDERDVRAVERLQVLVVEAGPLAELAVVGLQRLGGRRVVDDASTRARICSIFSKSASSSAARRCSSR